MASSCIVFSQFPFPGFEHCSPKARVVLTVLPYNVQKINNSALKDGVVVLVRYMSQGTYPLERPKGRGMYPSHNNQNSIMDQVFIVQFSAAIFHFTPNLSINTPKAGLQKVSAIGIISWPPSFNFP